MIPVIRPKDLVLSKVPGEIELACSFARRGARSYVTVEVQVHIDGQEIGTRDVAFRVKFEKHRLVALEQIPEGTILSAENTEIQTVESDRPEPADWKPPYGLEVTRTVPAHAEIRPDMIGAPRSSTVVHRNETVEIRLEWPGLVVSAMGTALQEAHAGEVLKVRNVDSNRIIMCRVRADGAVEPIL